MSLFWILHAFSSENDKDCAICTPLGTRTYICSKCRIDLKSKKINISTAIDEKEEELRKISETVCNEKLPKITGTKKVKTFKPRKNFLRSKEIKKVNEQKAFFNNYFGKYGVKIEDIEKYCEGKQITLERFISNLKSNIKKIDDYGYNYTDNLIEAFYLRSAGVSPLELIELFQKHINDQEFLHNFCSQYQVKMEDIENDCKEKQITLEIFISDLKSKIGKLDIYSGELGVKIGVKYVKQLFSLRSKESLPEKCMEVFHKCLDDYLENLKKCMLKSKVTIKRIPNELDGKSWKRKIDESHTDSPLNKEVPVSLHSSGVINNCKRSKQILNENSNQSLQEDKQSSGKFDESKQNKRKSEDFGKQLHAGEKKLRTTNSESQKSDFTSNTLEKVKESSIDLCPILFVYEENASSSTNSSDVRGEKNNACEKLLRSDINVTDEVFSVFANLDFEGYKKRKSDSFSNIITSNKSSLTCENVISDDKILLGYDINNSENRKKEKLPLTSTSNIALHNTLKDNDSENKMKSKDFNEGNDLGNKNNGTKKLSLTSISDKQTKDTHNARKTNSIECLEDVFSVFMNMKPKDSLSSSSILDDPDYEKESKLIDFNKYHLRNKDSVSEKRVQRDINTSKNIKNDALSDTASHKTASVVYKNDVKDDGLSAIISDEQTGGNLQKERKSGNFNIDSALRKKGSINETLLEPDINTSKNIKNDSLSDTASHKTSSVVYKNVIKEDVSSTIISDDRSDKNKQKKRKRSFSNKDNRNEKLLRHDINASENIKNDSLLSTCIPDTTTCHTLSSISIENDVTSNAPSAVMSNEQSDENRQTEIKGKYFNNLRNKDNASEGLPASQNIKNDNLLLTNIPDNTTCDTSSSISIDNDIVEDAPPTIISSERSNENRQRKRKREDFNDLINKDSSSETLLASQNIKDDNLLSESISDITSSSILLDNNSERKIKSDEFNEDNELSNKHKASEKHPGFNINASENIKTDNLLSINNNSGITACTPFSVSTENHVENDEKSTIISYYQSDGRKERKLEKFNKDSALSIKDIDVESIFNYFAVNSNITVSVLCAGTQSFLVNEIKLSTERKDYKLFSKFISDGNEKTSEKFYQFVFNFKKPGSPLTPPHNKLSYRVIPGGLTGQGTRPTRIIYRSEMSIFTAEKRVTSIKDCIENLRKNWNEIREFMDKAIGKKSDVKTSAGTPPFKRLSEEELISRRQEEIRSRLFGRFQREKSDAMDQELRNKQEVINQKTKFTTNHPFILTSSDDERCKPNGQSQNSNSGVPSTAQDANKSLFSKAKRNKKSKVMSIPDVVKYLKDDELYIPLKEKEVIQGIMKSTKMDSFYNEAFISSEEIADAIQGFTLSDDLNETPSSPDLSAANIALDSHNYSKTYRNSTTTFNPSIMTVDCEGILPDFDIDDYLP